MSDVSSNFRTFLLADTSKPQSIGQRVHEDHVPQAKEGQVGKDYVWYRKRSAVGMETLDSANGEEPRDFSFDVECVSTVQRSAKLIAEWVRSRCNCYRGAYGDDTVQGIFVQDQDDDYIPQSIGGDGGPFVCALDVRVITQ